MPSAGAGFTSGASITVVALRARAPRGGFLPPPFRELVVTETGKLSWKFPGTFWTANFAELFEPWKGRVLP